MPIGTDFLHQPLAASGFFLHGKLKGACAVWMALRASAKDLGFDHSFPRGPLWLDLTESHPIPNDLDRDDHGEGLYTLLQRGVRLFPGRMSGRVLCSMICLPRGLKALCSFTIAFLNKPSELCAQEKTPRVRPRRLLESHLGQVRSTLQRPSYG